MEDNPTLLTFALGVALAAVEVSKAALGFLVKQYKLRSGHRPGEEDATVMELQKLNRRMVAMQADHGAKLSEMVSVSRENSGKLSAIAGGIEYLKGMRK